MKNHPKSSLSEVALVGAKPKDELIKKSNNRIQVLTKTQKVKKEPLPVVEEGELTAEFRVFYVLKIRTILTEHIDKNNQVEANEQFRSICFVRILPPFEDI